MTETSTDLIDTTKITAKDIYVEDGGVDTVLNKIREVVDKFEPDITNRQGRMEVASIAARVARSKTFLDGQGKDMVAAQKAEIKLVDEKRKRIRDDLDALKEKVRKPLTEWEEAEKLRVSEHKNKIDGISAAGSYALLNWDRVAPEAMKEKLVEIASISVDGFEEFEDEAAKALGQALESIGRAIEKRTDYDTEKAEAARLREEAAERDKADREAAAEKRQAERDAQTKKDAEAEAAQSVKDAEGRAAVAEAASKAARAEALREATEKADAAKEVERLAEQDRKADQENRDRVEGDAVEAFIVYGLDEIKAAAVVAAISLGQIPNVKITY